MKTKTEFIHEAVLALLPTGNHTYLSAITCAKAQADALENAGECACFNRMMIGNNFVVLAVTLRGNPDVRFLFCRVAS